MPATRSNKEIIADICAIDANTKTDGLGQPELLKLLEDLTAAAVSGVPTPQLSAGSETPEQKAARVGAADAAKQAEANRLQAIADKAAEDGTAKHVVAEGKSITCLRGLLDAGSPVSVDDFHDKAKDFSRLFASGHIVKS